MGEENSSPVSHALSGGLGGGVVGRQELCDDFSGAAVLTLHMPFLNWPPGCEEQGKKYRFDSISTAH